MTDFKAASRKNWSDEKSKADQYPGDTNIIIGCLQRIADASEAMAKNHIRLQDDYDRMKRQKENYQEMYRTENKRVNAYKGQITKLKKKKSDEQGS